MARKKKNNPFTGDMEMDLTPMIDVVFQLIIFFMIVTDISSTDYVQLILPIAQNAQKDDKPTKHYIVVNVRNLKENGKYFYMVRGDKVRSYKALEKRIKIESKFAGKRPNPDAAGSMISKLKVIVRCDQNVEYGMVQDVFKACSVSGVWKVAVAANKPPK